jgi:hypothetical protein
MPYRYLRFVAEEIVLGVPILGNSVVQRGSVVFVNIDDRISSHNNRKNVIWYVFGL